MGDYQKTIIKKYPKLPSKKTPETRYWKSFKVKKKKRKRKKKDKDINKRTFT
jgi:hypothetical protein